MELRRAGVVPLCGQDGLFKYEIQVKTGWGRAAGESGYVVAAAKATKLKLQIEMR